MNNIDTAAPEDDGAQRIVLDQLRVDNRVDGIEAVSHRTAVAEIYRVGDQHPFVIVDLQGQVEPVTGFIGEGVVAAVSPEEQDRHILTAEVVVGGDVEVHLRQLARTGQVVRIDDAVVLLSHGHNPEQARRAGVAAVAVGPEAIGEVFELPVVDQGARLGADGCQSRGVIGDQEVETAQQVTAENIRHKGRIKVDGNGGVMALKLVVDLLNGDGKAGHMNGVTGRVGVLRTARVANVGPVGDRNTEFKVAQIFRLVADVPGPLAGVGVQLKAVAESSRTVKADHRILQAVRAAVGIVGNHRIAQDDAPDRI